MNKISPMTKALQHTIGHFTYMTKNIFNLNTLLSILKVDLKPVICHTTNTRIKHFLQNFMVYSVKSLLNVKEKPLIVINTLIKYIYQIQQRCFRTYSYSKTKLIAAKNLFYQKNLTIFSSYFFYYF